MTNSERACFMQKAPKFRRGVSKVLNSTQEHFRNCQNKFFCFVPFLRNFKYLAAPELFLVEKANLSSVNWNRDFQNTKEPLND